MSFGQSMQRAPNGQFSKLPDNPLDELEEGRKIREWAPGMGMGTSRTFGQAIPTAPLTPDKSVPGGLPFKGLRTGR